MSTPGTLRFGEINSTPGAPPSGYALIYIKTDNILYLQDSGGTEVALGSASSITGLTGDVGATGPGTVAATVNAVGGYTATQIASAVAAYLASTSSNTASTLVKRDGSGNFSATTITAALTGNVTGNVSGSSATFTNSLVGDVTGTQGATVVSTVAGSTAANVHAAELLANAATTSNTASTIVKRDASGNFTAGTVTANLTGTASNATTAVNFSGALTGDVTGHQGSTVVAAVGGSTASDVHSAELAANAATASNTASTIVERDASGNFAANIITSALTGAVTGNVTGNLTGNVTGNVTGNLTGTVTGHSTLDLPLTGGTLTDALSIIGSADKVQLLVKGNGTQTSDVWEVQKSDATVLAKVDNAGVFTALGNVLGANLSGTNTGDVSLTSVGSSPSANGASLSGQALTLQPADGSHPGLITSGTQTIGGNKTFSGSVGASNLSGTNTGDQTITLTSDVTGSGTGSFATTVAAVGGSTAANVHAAELLANAATNANTASTIVKRDGSGNFTAGTISAALSGNATTATTATNFSGSLSGDVTGTQGSTAIAATVVTGKALTGYSVGANTAISATDTILQAFDKTQGQINATVAAAVSSLTGDVTGTGPGATPTTIAVGAITDAKASLSNKPAVTVVATTNQALTGTPTIDGQATAANSLILLTAQSSGSENGPWMAQAGAWTRPTWYPSGGTSQAFQFITCLIRLGTVYQGSVWRQTVAAPITIDTTATTWVVTPTSGNYKSAFQLGPATGSSEVDLTFANANVGTLAWNPGSSFKLTIPATQGTNGSYLSNDGSGNLSWTNPLVNIDGGFAGSVYTSSQTITGGTA